MRNGLLLILTAMLTGCGGTLSDEQRKKIREDMEQHKIRRITESQIMAAAFEEGRSVADRLTRFASDSGRLDSMLTAEAGRIKWMEPGTSVSNALEKQLLDAYTAADPARIEDNVQMVHNAEENSDSILYTKPVIEIQDSKQKLSGVWNIWLSKKQLVQSMNKK